MTGRLSKLRRRWVRCSTRLRKKAARWTPEALTLYPFEVIAGLVALLMGLPFLLGLTPPAALIAIVSHVAFYVWSAGLTLGALTIGVGLKTRHPLALASGLQLVAGGFAVYAMAISVVMGIAGWTGAVVYLSLTLVSLTRAVHFRRLIDIQDRARRREDE